MSKLENVGKTSPLIKNCIIAASIATVLCLSGCNSTRQVLTHGYQLNEDALSLVPVGSSREQAVLSLGSPSTTQSNHDGSETFYYISQKKSRPVAFVTPKVIDQSVLAVYLDKNNTVERIANYGLKDGKAFDFIGRVTPTGGQEISFLNQILKATPNPGALLGGS